MELVGGGLDTNLVQSIAVNHCIEVKTKNRTQIHTSGMGGVVYRKDHDEDQVWGGSPDQWVFIEKYRIIGAPVEVRYAPAIEQMKVFYLGHGDAGLAAQYFQWSPMDEWSDLLQVKGPDLQPITPAVVAWDNDDSHLDLFAVARANNHLLHASYESEVVEWTDYEDLKGFVTTTPVAVSRIPGSLDVFARGGDAGLWHLSYGDGKWSDWTRISGDGKWSDWTRISGDVKIQGAPDAISVDSDSLDVFAWGEDGSMLHKSFDGRSKTWEPADGFQAVGNDVLSGPPKAMTDGPGRVSVFAYNRKNKLIWQKFRDAADDDWTVSPLGNVPMV